MSLFVNDNTKMLFVMVAIGSGLFLSIYNAIAIERNMNNQTIELVHGSGDAMYSVIWLHGLGAGADDFPPIVPELGLDSNRVIRFVFPQAPDRPITINGGMVMPGWYDIKGMNIADKEDLDGFTESQAIVEKIIQQQIELGVPSQNIILAGFSQGGAVAYYTALRSQHKLRGIIALSTYVPFAKQTETQASDVNKNIPILSMHGLQDPVVPIQLGQMSVELLEGMGYQPTWKTYPMPHSVVLEQIKDIGLWINDVFEQK